MKWIRDQDIVKVLKSGDEFSMIVDMVRDGEVTITIGEVRVQVIGEDIGLKG